MSAADLIPFSIVALAILILLGREWWRRKVIRKSMELSDELIGLLSEWEIIKLNRGLSAFLSSTDGKHLIDDPRIQRRLSLLASRIAGFESGRAAGRRARALRITGLKELTSGSEEGKA